MIKVLRLAVLVGPTCQPPASDAETATSSVPASRCTRPTPSGKELRFARRDVDEVRCDVHLNRDGPAEAGPSQAAPLERQAKRR